MPKPIDYKLEYKNHGHPLPSFTNAFVIEQIFIHLPMDPLMMWQLYYKVVGNTMAWNIFKIVRILLPNN